MEVVVVTVPITDTCKEVIDGNVRRTIPRDTLADARGPWLFPREIISNALDRVSLRDSISSLVDLCRVARLDVRAVMQP